jgi:hypothetical protein
MVDRAAVEAFVDDCRRTETPKLLAAVARLRAG